MRTHLRRCGLAHNTGSAVSIQTSNANQDFFQELFLVGAHVNLKSKPHPYTSPAAQRGPTQCPSLPVRDHGLPQSLNAGLCGEFL